MKSTRSTEPVTTADVRQSVDHLFRREAGRMVARLVGVFGIANLDLAEEAVQDAFVSALKTWPFHGEPDNPQGWLWKVARHRAIDVLRRRGLWNQKQDALLLETRESTHPEAAQFESELGDEQLALVFACCHPSLGHDSRVALTLKVVCGFSVSEVARAFLATEPTIAQRIVRAKRRLREDRVVLEIPSPQDLPKRLASVLDVLYLMFNEGYSAMAGEEATREDLCQEALRLTELIAHRHDVDDPRVDAMAALFCFQASRLPTRTNDAGDIVLLEEQERERWDRRLIQRGALHLRRSARGSELTTFHLEAEIAGSHALATTYAATNWQSIVVSYDALMQLAPSPVVALNRAVALGQAHGAEIGLRELERLEDRYGVLQGFFPFWASRGRMLERCGRSSEAASSYRQSLELTSNAPVRRFLEGRLRGLNESDSLA